MGVISDQSLLAVVLATSSDAMVAWNSGGSIVLWNDAAALLLGYSHAQVIGEPIASVLQLRGSPGAEHGQPGEAVHRNGRKLSLSVRVSAIHDAEGRAIGSLAKFREQEASPASDWELERLNLVLAAAQLGDWTWDAASDLVTMSQRAAELFNVPLSPRITWTQIRDLLHPEDRERARLAVEEAVLHRTQYAIEYRLVNGGRERWVSARGRGRYGRHGEVLGMFGVVQDITGYGLLLRIDDAVRTLTKPEDITYTAARVLGEYLGVNRCAYAFVAEDEDTFGLTGNYTNGAQSIVGTYRFRQFGAECLRLMRAGEPYVVADSGSDPRVDAEDRVAYELTSIRAVICVPILKAGRFVAAMAVHMNTPRTWSARETELVQQVASRCWESIERARVEREREGLLQGAEAANRAKDEFLAMLGHELRNPLAPIQTALELMKLRANAQSERERTVIERQVTHLTRLVDDLLDVSRIARGRVVLKPERIEIGEVVSRALEVASPLFEQRAHTLLLDLPSTGLTVEGDAARLVQVVSNLLTNAGKYTPARGRITITANQDGGEVVLSVRDTGVGIAGDVLPHVFDLFVQGRQTIDRAQGGLGLGLTIARNLVERHGGRVFAHSQGPEQGSEFIVRLPLASPPVPGADAKQEALAESAAQPDRSARILVVDDNLDAAELLAAVLESKGYEVQVAHDGPEALRLAALRAFDIALLDIGLPVMDGYELATRLKSLPNLRDARFVAVTGYGQLSDRERSSRAGFDHHLVKPVDFSTLDHWLTSSASAR